MRRRTIQFLSVVGILAVMLAVLPGVGFAQGMTGANSGTGMGMMSGVITWTPRFVAVRLAPGATKGMDVSFVSTRDISGATIKVSPWLTKSVTVSPTGPMDITKGVTVTVHLDITGPQSLSFARMGAIRVVNSEGRPVWAPLHVMILRPLSAR